MTGADGKDYAVAWRRMPIRPKRRPAIQGFYPRKSDQNKPRTAPLTRRNLSLPSPPGSARASADLSPDSVLQTRLEHLGSTRTAVAARRSVAMHRCLRNVDQTAAMRAICMEFVNQVGKRRGVDCGFGVQSCTSRNAVVRIYTPRRLTGSNLTNGGNSIQPPRLRCLYNKNN